MKEETLLELVERLDQAREEYRFLEVIHEWPRLRDALREMREFVLETAEGQEPTSYDASDLLARLDKGKVTT